MASCAHRGHAGWRHWLGLAAALVVSSGAVAQRVYETDILRETFGYGLDTQRSIALSELQQGCPARDCIPSIDHPKFLAASDATHVDDGDRVIAIVLDGEARAYPTRILDQHEIVNDVIADMPIAITWCPLCGSAVGIERTLRGEVTEFGVSGLLYNSDLVLYDRITETLWSQVEAAGIVGPLTGERLTLVPVTVARWGQWRLAHPDTLVLSDDTGFRANYSRDPYARYRATDELMFPVANVSDRLRPKEVVYGFQIDDRAVAYTESFLTQRSPYRHGLADREVTVVLGKDGRATLTDDETGESFVPVRLFWFAWFTFNPQTELFH